MKIDAFSKTMIGTAIAAVVVTVILSNMGIIGETHEPAIRREKPVKGAYSTEINTDTSKVLSSTYRFYCADTDRYYTSGEVSVRTEWLTDRHGLSL